MPPIINSEDTKVDYKTKNLFIDVTGLDLNAVENLLNIIVTALAERDCDIYTVNVGNKHYPNLHHKKFKLNLSYINKLLGLNVSLKEVKNYLMKMGYSFDKDILIPSYRVDILHEADIAEDIAIAYGYENFEEKIPNVATIAEESKFEGLKRKIANLLIGLGIQEVNTFHLTSESELRKMDHEMEFVALKNALNEDYTVLRPWLMPSLMKVLGHNKHNEYPQKLFECSIIFNKKLEEITRLAIVVSHSQTNFTDIKQILDALLSSLGLNYKIEETKHGSFIDGRVGRVSVNGKDIAYIGEVNPAVLSNFSLEMPVSALELNLSELFRLI